MDHFMEEVVVKHNRGVENTLYILSNIDVYKRQALERLAVACPEKASALLPASISRDGLFCPLSGVATPAQRPIRAGELTRERIAAEVYDVLARTVARMLDGACRRTGCLLYTSRCV